jgi:hypothetical protein
MTDNHSSTATSVLPFEYIDGPDFCTVIDANGDQFALTVQPDLMKRMEQALRDDIARLSRPPAQAPLAYRLDHPTHGVELSICQPSEDWVGRGWRVTPLYASALSATHRAGDAT